MRLLASSARPSVDTCDCARAEAGNMMAGIAASAAANNHCVLRIFFVIAFSGGLRISQQYIAEAGSISSEIRRKTLALPLHYVINQHVHQLLDAQTTQRFTAPLSGPRMPSYPLPRLAPARRAGLP